MRKLIAAVRSRLHAPHNDEENDGHVGERGIVLVEVIVSMVIIAVLSSMVGGSILGMTKISAFMSQRTALVNEMAAIEAMFRDDVGKMEDVTLGADPSSSFVAVVPDSGDGQCREARWVLSPAAAGFRTLTVESTISTGSSLTTSGVAFCSGSVLSSNAVEVSTTLTAETKFGYADLAGAALTPAAATTSKALGAVSIIGAIKNNAASVGVYTFQTADSLVPAAKGVLPTNQPIVTLGSKRL
jgi:type II secretory pathway pseudopilin PulG